LDKKDITEVKSFAKPPELVSTVLCAVCLLFKKKETWDEAKKLMGDSKFLDNLKEYDKDALTNDTKLTAKMKKYLDKPEFQPDVVKKVSKAATSLCMWVRAMDVYGRVAREIGPKKLALAEAEKSAAAANELLAAKKAELKKVSDKVAALRQKLFQAKRKAEQLVKDAEDCQVKLGRAQELLKG
jgi:dynein heavy chain, axonemal